MGANTLTNKVSGNTIFASDLNELQTSLNGDFVGRNSSGAPATGQNLGTAAIPWGAIRGSSLIVGGASVDVSQVSAPPFRIVSGETRSTSNQPVYLRANGAAATLHIDAATTNLVFDVNGVTNTLTADLSKTSLTLAPSTNNTCAVNDTTAADQADTKLWGEENPFATKKTITIDTVGTEITALDGKLAAFSHGAGPEYFLARVDTSNNRLHKCKRGYFFDSSDAPVKREVFTNNDVLTLMKLGWVFLDDDLTTIDVSYTEPVWSFTSPSSPATGDYWYDMGNSLMKRYDGATFQTVDRAFVGMVVLDATNCVASRSASFDKTHRNENSLELEIQSTEIVRAKAPYSKVYSNGTLLDFQASRPAWNITTDLATSADMDSATEQASTYYGLFLKDTGDTVISDLLPVMREDAFGLYHVHNDDWRFVGECYNDAGSDIVGVEDETDGGNSQLIGSAANGYGGSSSGDTFVRNLTTVTNSLPSVQYIARTTTTGDKFVFRRDAVYTLFVTDFRSGSDTPATGFSLNSSNTSTHIFTLAIAQRICEGSADILLDWVSATATFRAMAGDIGRIQDHGSNTGDTLTGIRIEKVRNI